MAQAQQDNVITEEELNELSKKWYGLSNKDIEELSVFINEFDDACKDLPEVATYDDLKAVVDSGNKIPSHCGHMIFSYFVNRHGDDKLINMIISMYNVYTELFAEDPESTKTTDIYETLSCCVLFAPHKTLRKFVQKYFDTAEKLLKIIRKRPSSAGCLLARYSELYTTSKHDAKYAKSIISTFNDMIAFLQEKNDITPEVPDAVSINFNELRDIISGYLDAGNKKESLKKINNLINKKADIGQAFFTWVAENPACAIEVIQNTAEFDTKLPVKFMQQMKIQHLLETICLLQFLTDDKLQPMIDYIKNTYKLETFDDYYDRLVKIVQKGGVNHYGILLRHIDFLPLSPTQTGELMADSAKRLQDKLSSVANNLTADTSEKSLSITIAPLGRSRVYQDIVDKLEGIDTSDAGGEGGGNSFLAKLRDKDVIKKIRESGASYLAVDQYCGSITSMLLEIIQSNSKKTQDRDFQTFQKETYKEAVLKYGIIYTLPYFNYCMQTLVSKLQPNDNNAGEELDDGSEDYEDLQTQTEQAQ